MNARILDKQTENGRICYLCKISLEDYIQNLPPSYREYEIQREIVANVYLDQLVSTVLERRHIPPIVLVVEESKVKADTLTFDHFKILDGLQRTFRLKAIRDTIQLIDEIKNPDELADASKFKLSRLYSNKLQEINSNTQILQALLKRRPDIHQCFSNNTQWFEIWSGLSEDDEIRKMLVLNAGHKPVKPKHQLELLFLNLLPKIDAVASKTFILVREKERSATTFSKNRTPNEFHFAHVIASLLSFVEGQPITTNTSLLQGIHGDTDEMDRYNEMFTASFLRAFVNGLVKIDGLITKNYGDTGVKWFGREVSVTGLFGALGHNAKETKSEAKSVLDRFISLLQEKPGVLKLEEYEDQRNNMDLGKINFGRVNKDAVFDAISELLKAPTAKSIVWKDYFVKS